MDCVKHTKPEKGAKPILPAPVLENPMCSLPYVPFVCFSEGVPGALPPTGYSGYTSDSKAQIENLAPRVHKALRDALTSDYNRHCRIRRSRKA